MRPFRSRSRRVAAAVAALAMLVAGCGSDTTDPPPAQDPQDPGTDPADDAPDGPAFEGRLTVYSSLNPDASESLLEGFREAYPGVDVGYLRLATGPLTVRYQQEQDAGVVAADVVIAADPVFFQSSFESGYWADLDPAEVASLANWPSDPISGTYVSVVTTLMGINYNTDLVTGDMIPTSWEDLLSSEFTGRMLLVDPRNVPVYVNLFMVLREQFGDEFLEGIAAQNPELVPSAVPGAQQLAAGEALISFPSVKAVTEPLKAQGAPVETLILEPTVGSEFHAAISEAAPNPEGARIFMDYLLSVEGQTRVAQAFYGASVLGDLPGSEPFPDGYVAPDVPTALEQLDEIAALLGIQ